MGDKILRKCFIIMPFVDMRYTKEDGETIELNKSQLDYFYEDFIKKAVDSFKSEEYTFSGERYTSSSGNFIKGIVNKLYQADVVIADITGLNPNVMYELGIRHTLMDNTILLAQDTTQIPSDLKSYIAVIYDYPWDTHKADEIYSVFEKQLHKALNERLEKWDESDNPVRDFLSIKQVFRNEQRIEQIKSNLMLITFMNNDYELVLIYLKKAIKKWTVDNTFPAPYIEKNWFHFVFMLLSNSKDIVHGNKINNVYRSMMVTNTNLAYLRNNSKGKDELDIYNNELNITNIDKINIILTDFNDDNMSKALGFDRIAEEWHDELNKLT